jgi:Arc/MetJ-type ribon-helix-helix transcriptional regulator
MSTYNQKLQALPVFAKEDLVGFVERALPRPEGKDIARRHRGGAEMKTFTVSIDEKLDRVLDDLKDSLGKTSRAEVFRLAVTLLKMATEAKEEGLKLTLADKQNKVQSEILIPG